jgi:hypothetical protein
MREQLKRCLLTNKQKNKKKKKKKQKNIIAPPQPKWLVIRSGHRAQLLDGRARYSATVTQISI